MSEELNNFVAQLRKFETTLPKKPPIKKAEDLLSTSYPDDILPFDLYRGKRGNITKIGDQINKAYYFEIYDGCAVLMRHLIEMLLVLAFKEHKIESEIKGPNGNYYDLSGIISVAKTNLTLDLSRIAKDYLEPFREKGNLSAHNIFYNARKKDLEPYQPKFRALVEELLYKAGIIK